MDFSPQKLTDELTRQVIGRLIGMDPEEAREVLNELRHDGESDRKLARRVTRYYARRGAIRGLVTGLPGGLIAILAGVVDVRSSLRLSAATIATIGEIAEPGFLDRDDCQRQVFTLLFRLEAGEDDDAASAAVAARTGIRIAARHLVSSQLPRFLRKQVQQVIVQRLSSRAISRFVPLVGGLIGATWNYLEIHYEGNRAARVFLGEDLDDASSDATEAVIRTVGSPLPEGA